MQAAFLFLVLFLGAAVIFPQQSVASSSLFPLRYAAPAQQQTQTIESEKTLPLYIQADHIVFDKTSNTIIAEGNVEISQFLGKKEQPTLFHFETLQGNELSKQPRIKERFLKADKIIYNRTAEKITAMGHVTFIDEENNVLFTDFVQVDEKFDNGFISSLKILLSNEEGRLTAQEGERTQGNRTVFRKATYSPCKICKDNPLPLWQIRSRKVTHDQNAREVRYNNAYLDIFGVPVVYLPYFKHPDPGIKRKSGFIMPLVGNSSDLGIIVQVPYFWAITPHSDLTISPILTTKQGPVFATEYRHRYTRGDIKAGGSLTRNTSLNRYQIRSNQPTLPTPSKTRYHLYSKGRFELNQDHLFTFDLIRASDTTYLRRYSLLSRRNSLIQNKNLTSEIKLERFKSNSYGSVRTVAFQTDTPKTTPYVFPLAQYMYKSDPGRFNETLRFDGNFLSLIRKRDISGLVPRNCSRAVGSMGVNLPYVNSAGHLYDTDLSLRGDMYQIGTYQKPTAARASSYTTGRAIPTASFTWRYPLMRPVFGTPYMIEPLAQMVLSPNNLNPVTIPNEDSRYSELDDQNLFFINRMNGFDQTDSGKRVIYGINNGFFGEKGRRLFVFLGQSYRLNKKPVSLVGDHKKASDYVTRIQVIPIHWFKLHYRGRFEPIYLKNQFSELTSNFGVPRLTLSNTMAYVNKAATPGAQDIKQLNWRISSQITDEWNISFTQSRNFAKGQRNSLAYIASLVYQNDCFQMSTGVYHTKFRDRDIKPDTGFLVQFSFKDLGTFKPYASSSLPNISLRKLDYGE